DRIWSGRLLRIRVLEDGRRQIPCSRCAVVIAEDLERTFSFAAGIPELIEQLADTNIGVGGLIELVHLQQHLAEVVPCRHFSVGVPDLLEQVTGTVIGVDGLLKPTHLSQRQAEVVLCYRFAMSVPELTEKTAGMNENVNGYLEPAHLPQRVA